MRICICVTLFVRHYKVLNLNVSSTGPMFGSRMMLPRRNTILPRQELHPASLECLTMMTQLAVEHYVVV